MASLFKVQPRRLTSVILQGIHLPSSSTSTYRVSRSRWSQLRKGNMRSTSREQHSNPLLALRPPRRLIPALSALWGLVSNSKVSHLVDIQLHHLASFLRIHLNAANPIHKATVYILRSRTASSWPASETKPKRRSPLRPSTFAGLSLLLQATLRLDPHARPHAALGDATCVDVQVGAAVVGHALLAEDEPQPRPWG